MVCIFKPLAVRFSLNLQLMISNSKSVLVFFACAVLLSCSQSPKALPYGNPVASPEKILQDMMSFLQYRANYVRLYEDFEAVNTASEPISKENFLKQLATGEYLPLRLNSSDSTTYYQLYKITGTVDKEIKQVIKYWGLDEYAYSQVEGKQLPDYKFVDLDGKVYTKQNTKGKIFILKCWFIACQPCVKEIPELNALKQQYKNRDDILFVSISWDSKKDLKKFLSKVDFDYAIVPEQEQYLEDSLQLNAYPTHFVINKQGLIAKKVSDFRGLAYALKKEASL